MQRPSLRAHALVFAALTMCLTALPAHAQSTPTTPAFSLATSHIYSTKESPAFSLTHRGVDHLDFRVYRVNDAFAFFEKLTPRRFRITPDEELAPSAHHEPESDQPAPGLAAKDGRTADEKGSDPGHAAARPV